MYTYSNMYTLIIEIKRTINATPLNHPETIPPQQSVKKLSSMKSVLGAKNVGDCYLRETLCSTELS